MFKPSVTGVEDYNTSVQHTVPANTTRFQFNVSIVNDDIFEGNQDFLLTIHTSLPIVVDGPYQITVTIMDDDREL